MRGNFTTVPKFPGCESFEALPLDLESDTLFPTNFPMKPKTKQKPSELIRQLPVIRFSLRKGGTDPGFSGGRVDLRTWLGNGFWMGRWP